jgi:sugar phosphate isomerase/epimerase
MRIMLSRKAFADVELIALAEQVAAVEWAGIELASSLPLDSVEQESLSSELDEIRQASTQRPLVMAIQVDGALCSVDGPPTHAMADRWEQAVDWLAEQGFAYVRVPVRSPERGALSRRQLGGLVPWLAELGDRLAASGMKLLLENSAVLRGSADLWSLMDAVGHPSVQVAWCQAWALSLPERPSLSLPRLSRRLGLVRLCDVRLDAQQSRYERVPPGDGEAEIPKQIELLRGLAYDGWLLLDQSVQATESESQIEQLAVRLKEWQTVRQEVLMAYFGDRNPGRVARRG